MPSTTTLFISDLHLDLKRPAITTLFLDFLSREAGRARALYILGDLFEAWIGDDMVSAESPVLRGLREFAATTPLFVMHGNRDFLLGERFEALTGARLIPGETVIELGGVRTLLLHGDELCTDDVEYQRFRAMVRDPAWQREFLALPLAERVERAKQARSQSAGRNQALEDYLMDVNQAEVERVLRAHGVSQMIHGHTHRPAIHHFELDGEPCTRVVLGDWYEQGSVLRVSEAGLDLQSLPLTTD